VGHGFPWPVLLINVAGSALLGVVLARGVQPALRDGIGIGFCGGFTTFSTFAVEVATFMRDDRVVMAAVYAAVSVVGAVVAFAAARALAR
jgi:CrcB protein